MTTLAVATLLLSDGAVFAASDHYGSQDVQRPATMSDPTYTFSNEIGTAGGQKPPATKDEYGRGPWGR
ncbi:MULTISPECIES: DUF680 domain-containing protein [unclassified Mesorhizobium]|uniref:DUF680 domain-containing protein n=1 Tax=unclassified Mesorhizobium TaxID=325217 RepID=UPI0033395033